MTFRFLKAIFLVCLATLHWAEALAAHGGGASNGGGKAISCLDENFKQTIVMLDVYNLPLAPLPVNRAEFGAEVYRRLAAVDKELAELWYREWRDFGPASTWPLATGDEIYGYDASAELRDFFPARCAILAVAGFGQTLRPMVNPITLNFLPLFQRPILELHESLYILGWRTFGHRSPRLTWNLIRSVLGAEVTKDRLRSAARNFRSPPAWHLRCPLVGIECDPNAVRTPWPKDQDAFLRYLKDRMSNTRGMR